MKKPVTKKRRQNTFSEQVITNPRIINKRNENQNLKHVTEVGLQRKDIFILMEILQSGVITFLQPQKLILIHKQRILKIVYPRHITKRC